VVTGEEAAFIVQLVNAGYSSAQGGGKEITL
jgi:hypothetical protein